MRFSRLRTGLVTLRMGVVTLRTESGALRGGLVKVGTALNEWCMEVVSLRVKVATRRAELFSRRTGPVTLRVEMEWLRVTV